MAKWIIDPDHSVAAFSIKHMMLAHVRGQFHGISGAIEFDPKDPARSSVYAEIDVSTVYTGIKKRDEHLRNEDFFNASKFPKMIFKSTRIEVTGPHTARVGGDLTIAGITRSVLLDVEYFGPVKAPYGGEIGIGFVASARINREDFGIKWNVPMEAGMLLPSEADITLDIEADL